jgi:hypothetical protein
MLLFVFIPTQNRALYRRFFEKAPVPLHKYFSM